MRMCWLRAYGGLEKVSQAKQATLLVSIPSITPGSEESSTLKVCDLGKNIEMMFREATFECVLTGCSLDEVLPSYCCVDPHIMDAPSGSLGDCEQPVDTPYDEDWRPVGSKKKNKERGDGTAKVPKGPKKDYLSLP
jgi:hypothetical protein